MSTLVVIATLKSKPEQASALRTLLQSLVTPTLAEEGCLRYELNEAEDGQGWIYTEQWASRPMWERHMASPHLERFKKASEELVAHFEVFTGTLLGPST